MRRKARRRCCRSIGGKITTFRRLAETVMEKIEAFFPGLGRAWTATIALPGGDFAYQDRKRCLDDFARRYAFLPPREAERLFGAYGTHAEMFMAGGRSINDMGRRFGAISEREVRYLVKQGVGAHGGRHSMAANEAWAANFRKREQGAARFSKTRE